ncbi:MAG: hypothetical protein ABH883_10035, partial [Candidatus Omnitrophota bacterium]
SSGKADTYKKAADPLLINSVSVIKADLSYENTLIKNISGNIQIDKLSISKGKVSFSYNGGKYLADFAPIPGSNTGYEISARSDKLSFSGTFIREKNNLLIDKLKGMYYVFYFSMRGEILDFLSEDKHISLNGTIDADLQSFSSLPGKAGDLAEKYSMSGLLRSNFTMQAKKPDLAQCEIKSTFTGENLIFEKLRIKEIAGKMTVAEGRVIVPLVTGTVYNGTLSGEFRFDAAEKDLPYICSLFIKNMDFGSFMDNMTGKKSDVFGNFNADLSVQGYYRKPLTSEGTLKISITDANLGQMPVLTPVFGDIFDAARKIIPGAAREIIKEARGDFKITDGRLTTDNITFISDDILVKSYGYLDFNGALDFRFENEIRETSGNLSIEWQAALRNAIINLGKFIKKRRLYGTLKEPKWGI